MRDTSSPVKASAKIDINAPLETDIARWQAWNADIEEMTVNGPIAAGTEKERP